MRRIVLVLLLLAASPLWSAIGTDVTVSTDRSSSSITAPSFSTTSPNESLPSYGACDNPIVRTLGPNQTVGQQYYLASLVPGLGAGSISAALRTHRHTISGSITSGTNGAGATVTLSGAASATTTADANGNYSFAGLANGSYTVTPSKAGFTFSPASTAVTINGANQTANFTASAVSYSISGTITNGAGATVTLSGAASATTTADANGNYSFTGLANGSYTVTPTKTGFVFTPAAQTAAISGGSQTANFSATQTWTVSGVMTPTANGTGATVTLTQGTTTIATATANSTGAYTFNGVVNGAYTVTPSKSGFVFTPSSQSISVSGANVGNVNFTVAAPTWTIQGTISGGSGTTVTLTQGSTTVTSSTADSNGNYTLNGVVNGTYTVTPSKAGYIFTPASQTVTVSGANAANVNFTVASTWGIQGNISPASFGTGATLTLTQGASTIATASADSNGNYTFNAVVNGTYTVTPAKNGYSFIPSSQSVTVSGAAVTGVNFTALAGLAIDVVAYGDSSSASTSAVTSAFSTTSANELLLAFIATDASSPGMTVTRVTGGGLTWALVRRTNAQMGTAEVWSAFASFPLGNVSVTATLAQSVVSSITVVSFTGTDTSGTNGSGAIGATAGASASSGAPTATLVTTRTGSWVFGVGNDWDTATARTPGANQTIVHQLLSATADTYWVQRQNSTTALSGTSVAINDTAPTSDRYNLTVVEVLPPGTTSVASYSISGSLSPAAQASGATVTLSGAASATTTADSAGNYTFSGLANGFYTVTPTKSGISFTPASQAVTVNGASSTAVNFAVQTWSLSGNLSPASNSAGATLTLGGAGSSTTTADTSGNYTFSGLTNGTYSVTPSKSGYSFSPAAQSGTINGANVAGVNFTVSVTSGVTVSISPTSASVATGGTQQFSATVTGTTNTAVTWSATAGSASSSGLYTAPGTAGTYTVTATSVTDSTKSASATVNVTSATTSDVLLGDQSVENQTNSIATGQAEAFQATAKASGNLKSLVIYLDASSTVSQLVAGLYADAGGHPGTVLGQGSSTPVVKGAWNPISLPSTNVVAGTPYWIAILGTGSGTLAFRASSGGCNAETDSQSSLTSLPSNWSTGAVSSNCPVSVFGTAAVIGVGTCPAGMNPAWTCNKRPGDGSNSESEIYLDTNLALAGGVLTMTSRNTPSASASGTYLSADVPTTPYISCSGSGNPGTYSCTGNYSSARIMWTTFNQQYGDFQVRAKLGYSWPAIWMLGSNCQATEISGPSSIAPCNWDSPGSGEIDIAEGFSVSAGSSSVHHSLFIAGQTDPGCTAGSLTDITTNFHVYEAKVSATNVTWYVDGTQTCTQNGSFTDNWFLIVNTAIGGNQGGTPSSYSYPNSGQVDWVKVCSAACANGITGAAASNGTFFDDFLGVGPAAPTSLSVFAIH